MKFISLLASFLALTAAISMIVTDYMPSESYTIAVFFGFAGYAGARALEY